MARKASLIKGIVKDPDGNPISGARVSFTDGPLPLPDIAALTDINGTFTLSAPVPGVYSIEIVSDEAIKSEKIDIDNNQDRHFEIILSRHQR